jgi:hypothetical protein
MAGAVGTDFFICWVFEIAAFVSYGRIDNTGKLTKSGFHTPKTSCTKCCFFYCHSVAPSVAPQLLLLDARDPVIVISLEVNSGSILGA